MTDTDREARLEEIRHEVRQEVKRRLIPDEVHGGNYQGEITIAVLEEKVVGLLSEIDRLREIEEAARDYVGSEAVNERDRLKAKLEGEDG